jgi:long-chain acyl-CoA synthetase
MFNLAIILRESAMATPDKDVAVYDGGHMTYAQLDARSDTLAAGLAASGLQPGDPVGLQLPNITEFLVAYFGILKAGGVVVPMNVLLKSREISYCLSNSGASTLITWSGIADEATKGASDAGVSRVYVVGAVATPTSMMPFTDLLTPVPARRPMAVREPTDTAAIVFTAGTTGSPKGAELTHFQLYMNSDIPGRLFDVQRSDIVLTALPLFHIFGLSSVLNVCVRFGATMSLVPRFDPEVVLKAIQRDRITVFEGVPTMFVGVLEHPEVDKFDTSSLRIAISGGAPIPASVLDSFEAKFGVVILEGYGMSETAATTTFNQSVSDRRAYSVGKPIWGTEVQIWDQAGQELPAGRDHVGELVTRGFHTMKGYLGQPESTADAFAGGWLHTGDLGYVDEDGFFFIIDRKKELIIRGGYNVYPREVEEVLYGHPAVAEAAVIGIPDGRLGEEVKAFVVVRPGVDASAAEIIAWCRDRMAAYKYPRMIELRDVLPKNATGKIDKLQLRGLAPTGA